MLKKFLSFSYGNGFGLIIGFITTIITTRLLKPEDFGKTTMFTLATNVIMILVVFGSDQSFVRFFFEESENKRGGLLFNCLKIPITLGLFSILILLIFQKQISILLFGEYKFEVICLLILAIIFQSVYRYAILVIRMNKRGHLYSILEIINRSLQLIFLLIFIYLLSPTYEAIIYSIVISSLILPLIGIGLEKKYWSVNNFKVNNLTHTQSDIIKYSFPLVFQTLIFWLFQSSDKIALREWSNFHELGLFSAAFKIIALLNVVQVAFTTFWTPVCFEAYEKNPSDKRLYEKMSKYVSLGLFTVAIMTIIFKDTIMSILGSDYKSASVIVPFLVYVPIMFTISETTVIGINFFKKTKWHILIAVIACLSNITFNWILVPDYGGVGAAISTGLSYVIFFTFRTFISLKYYKVDYKLYKIYIMIALIGLYGGYSLFNYSFFINLLIGTELILILVLLYIQEFVSILKKILGIKIYRRT